MLKSEGDSWNGCKYPISKASRGKQHLFIASRKCDVFMLVDAGDGIRTHAVLRHGILSPAHMSSTRIGLALPPPL